jgi:hypothetical protein
MDEADGVVFASPVYGMNVTGQMKIFIDRFCYNFHRPRFFEKKAFLLATTGVMGEKDVLKYLETVARMWGFGIAGKAGLVSPIPVPHKLQEKNSRMIEKGAKYFAAALQNEKPVKPGLMDVIIFRGERAAFSQLGKISPADYRYWNEKGWFDRRVRYFTGAPVNPLYHAIGAVVERITAWQIRKDLLEE